MLCICHPWVDLSTHGPYHIDPRESWSWVRAGRLIKIPQLKDLHDPDHHDGVIMNLEQDILECKVEWALGSITRNKASGSDGIPVELFQILKNDAVKVLHSICQQIWKTQQWPQGWKRSVFILILKKGSAKECSNYHTIALISHASKSTAQNYPSQTSMVREPWTSRCSSWF